MLNYYEVAGSLPPEYPFSLVDDNRLIFLKMGITVIVLDDDPTGTQTMHQVPVLTTWGEEEITSELNHKTPLFFILTNSRSLTAPDADCLAETIGANIRKASERSERKVIVISRGDSTLRGHYPNEVDALGKGLAITDAPHILVPALFQGGRHTVNDVHYVREGDQLIPAAETPFAKDSVFGYHSSDLKAYVEEKTKGRIRKEDVISINLDLIRNHGPEKITTIISGLKPGQVCIVNAFSQSDLDVFASGLLHAMTTTTRFLFRTAASFLNSISGSQPGKLLSRKELGMQGSGSIIAVGSYVPKTTRQLEYLRKSFDADYLEISAAKLLSRDNYISETERVTEAMNESLARNRSVVIFTSRELIKGGNAAANLDIVNRVSEGMVRIIHNINIRPEFVIAKGGITSSDIVTRSFGVKRAFVEGQVIPGVPVWKLGDCKAFPDLVYIPFPGNLGGDDALSNAIEKLI
jgi:uncharacterized protein YgbK (DUF1537 family)